MLSIGKENDLTLHLAMHSVLNDTSCTCLDIDVVLPAYI